MFTRINHRVYALPTMLFLFLSILFISAGMSSFTYLKHLDVDYVKIDGSFVRNIVHNAIDHATVTAINNIAHSMGKQTVAEFVVDSATADVLRELKVDYGQGYALDKPKPLAHRVQWRVKLAAV